MGIIGNIRGRIQDRKINKLISKGSQGIDQIAQLDDISKEKILLEKKDKLYGIGIVRIINSLDDISLRTNMIERYVSVLSQEHLCDIIIQLPQEQIPTILEVYKDNLDISLISNIIRTIQDSKEKERLVLEFRDDLKSSDLYDYVNSMSEEAVMTLLVECRAEMGKFSGNLGSIIRNNLFDLNNKEKVLDIYKDQLVSDDIYQILQEFPEEIRVRLLDEYDGRILDTHILQIMKSASTVNKINLIKKYYDGRAMYNIKEILGNAPENEKLEIIKETISEIASGPAGQQDIFSLIKNVNVNKKELLDICKNYLTWQQITSVLKDFSQEEQFEFLKNNNIGLSNEIVSLIKQLPENMQLEICKYQIMNSYNSVEALKVIAAVSKDEAMTTGCKQDFSIEMLALVLGKNIKTVEGRKEFLGEVEDKYKQLYESHEKEYGELFEENDWNIVQSKLLKEKALLDSGVLSKEQEEKIVNNWIKSKSFADLKPEVIEQLVADFRTGKIDVDSFEKISSNKDIQVYEIFGELYDSTAKIPDDFLELANVKQVRQIYKVLAEKEVNIYDIAEIAVTMYSTLGFNNSIEILQDKYGEIDASKIEMLFKGYDLSEVIYEQDGKGFKPKLNDKFINLLLGKSYKIEGTPLRNLLEGQMTGKQKEFIKKISDVYNNWDVIEEEFSRKKNSSDLKLKLNVGTINEIIKNLSDITFEPRDYKLSQTDILQYAGKDTQFTANKSKQEVVSRAVTLSREMEKVKTKKFPYVKVEQDGSSLEVMHPQDRSIFTVGYKTHCCFRPCGNADGAGEPNSLLRYCTSTEYAGGLIMKDQEGNVEAFSPILRNGNVLVIHSIESDDQDVQTVGSEKNRRFHDMIVEFGKQQIELTKQEEDEGGIKFVVLGNLHYMNPEYSKGILPKNVRYYDQSGEYEEMYTNLECAQMVVAEEENAKFDDIELGQVSKTYEYDRPPVKMVNIREEDSQRVEKCKAMKSEIVRKTKAIKDIKDVARKQEALREIEQMKAEYLKEFDQVIGGMSDNETMRAVIESIDGLTGKEMQSIENPTLFMYSDDWYIVCNTEGDIISNSLETGKEECSAYLQKQRALMFGAQDKEQEKHITGSDLYDAVESEITTEAIGEIVKETNMVLEKINNKDKNRVD